MRRRDDAFPTRYPTTTAPSRSTPAGRPLPHILPSSTIAAVLPQLRHSPDQPQRTPPEFPFLFFLTDSFFFSWSRNISGRWSNLRFLSLAQCYILSPKANASDEAWKVKTPLKIHNISFSWESAKFTRFVGLIFLKKEDLNKGCLASLNSRPIFVVGPEF